MNFGTSSFVAAAASKVTVGKALHEHDAIAKTLQPYIDGMKSGKGDDMKPAFHKDATIFGYAGADLVGGPIQQLFDWSDQSEPATELQTRIASIDLAKTVATVRLVLTSLNGARYSVMLRRLIVDGEWKIMSKVFHLHS